MATEHRTQKIAPQVRTMEFWGTVFFDKPELATVNRLQRGEKNVDNYQSDVSLMKDGNISQYLVNMIADNLLVVPHLLLSYKFDTDYWPM